MVRGREREKKYRRRRGEEDAADSLSAEEPVELISSRCSEELAWLRTVRSLFRARPSTLLEEEEEEGDPARKDVLVGGRRQRMERLHGYGLFCPAWKGRGVEGSAR